MNWSGSQGASRESTVRSRNLTYIDASAFRHRLLRWFRLHGRNLPWRRPRDPFRVMVSELMLQQAQVPGAARTAWALNQGIMDLVR